MQVLGNNTMHNHGTSEFTLAMTAIALGVGKIMEWFVEAEPVLAGISYLVAIIAGLVTIYQKFKRK